MKRFCLVLAGLAGALLTSSAQEAKAGNIFDDFATTFFGAPRQAAPVYYEPLQMTVKKRRKVARHQDALQRFPEVSSKPSPPVVKLDPAADPNWFLGDPTLRRGDIVVTRQGVLVYQGRDADSLRRSDFASLGGKTGGKAWEKQLKAAAAGGRSYFNTIGTPVPVTQVTAQTQ